MPEYLFERALPISVDSDSSTIFTDLDRTVGAHLRAKEIPVRFAVTKSAKGLWDCDIGVHAGCSENDSIFRFEKRTHEDTSSFTVVMLVPTGIGAEIGGHAGDAAPAAALLANVCDTLIAHPNVFNASDLIDIPGNALYVEGSVITRMMMGAARLMRVKSNRVLVIVQEHNEHLFTEAAINAVNAARAYFGLQVSEVVTVGDDFRMISEYSQSGLAAGCVEGLDPLWSILDAREGLFDAVAISSVIEVPPEFHQDYYLSQGAMVNPWGGVEALLTHAISLKYGVPAAHAPMFESREIAELDVGVVDPRMAAEVVSVTFLESVLRGLQRSPRILKGNGPVANTIGAESVSCLVVPSGILGLPTLAAIGQGIPVVAVRENSNIMRNDLNDLPWLGRQLLTAENYWEAAGVVASLRAGMDPYSVRRPLIGVPVSRSTRKSADHRPVATQLPWRE